MAETTSAYPVVMLPGTTSLAVKHDGKYTVPNVVNGFPVVGAVKINTNDGESRDQWVVICRKGDEWVVWYAYIVDDRADGVDMVAALTGMYTRDGAAALAEFVRRIDARGLVAS